MKNLKLGNNYFFNKKIDNFKITHIINEEDYIIERIPITEDILKELGFRQNEGWFRIGNIENNIELIKKSKENKEFYYVNNRTFEISYLDELQDLYYLIFKLQLILK